MPLSGSERRRALRRVPGSDETLTRVRLRTGRELAVVDVASLGALVEGATRLLPGTHVDVHVVTRHGRVLVRTRVVRAWVWHLEADAVQYRAALAFATALDTEADGYPVPTGIGISQVGAGNPYPEAGVGSLAGVEERPTARASGTHVHLAPSLVADRAGLSDSQMRVG